MLLGGAGTGGTGLWRRSELILLGRGFGGLSGASTGSEKAEITGRVNVYLFLLNLKQHKLLLNTPKGQ